MPRKKTMSLEEKEPYSNEENTTILSPFVFISHDSRDAELAKAFGELLKKASTGVVKYFCSSDRSGKEGIEYGSEWYPTIIEKVEKASDVVCLLTERSINRPWLLYEAGMAKGKKNSKVSGLVLGTDINVATEGPFAQFQNCSDDKESIVKLVMQLVKNVPNAEPDRDVIAIFVDKFLKVKDDVLKKMKSESKTTKKSVLNSDINASAKLFEEIKLMFKDLSAKSNIDQNRSREQKWMQKRMIFDYLRHRNFSPRVAVRMGFYFYKDSKPWIYEEGNFLLNQLLDGKNDRENIMRQLYELLNTTRQFRYDLQEPFAEYEDMVNDIILDAMNYIATEFERKVPKNKKQS